MAFPPDIKKENDKIRCTWDDGHDIRVIRWGQDTSIVIAQSWGNKVSSERSFIISEPRSPEIDINSYGLNDWEKQKEPHDSSLKLDKKVGPKAESLQLVCILKQLNLFLDYEIFT